VTRCHPALSKQSAKAAQANQGHKCSNESSSINWCPWGGDLEDGGQSLQNGKHWSPGLGLSTPIRPSVRGLEILGRALVEILGRALEWREVRNGWR
jgi:hypothetical protein